jgi:hypothetical protein
MIGSVREAPMSTDENEAIVLRNLLGKRPLEKFSSKELAGKAHWRWNREEYFQAAVLFEAAAQRATDEARLERPSRDNTFCYRAPSGVCFRLAGEHERAWPVLLEATKFDWEAAGIPEDDNFSEWAFVEMLCVLADAQNSNEFSKIFWNAVDRGRELGDEFPQIHPKQELLLDLCECLGLSKELVHVIARIEARGKVPKQLAQRISRLKLRIKTTD